jgi:hypothetical protein
LMPVINESSLTAPLPVTSSSSQTVPEPSSILVFSAALSLFALVRYWFGRGPKPANPALTRRSPGAR